MGRHEVRELLENRRDAIAADWREVIARTSFVSLDGPALSDQLVILLDRLVAAMLAEPFSTGKGQGIGEALAQLECSRPETLGGAVALLGQQLLAGLPTEDFAALHPRLAVLLGEISTGFLRQSQRSARSEQEAIHRALLAAREHAENALRSSEARYWAVVTQATEGIVLLESPGALIVETNPAFQQLLGYSEEDLIGMSLYDIVADQRGQVARNLRLVVRKGQYAVGERRYRRKDGAVVSVEGSATTLTGDHGNLVCIIVRDITERMRVEAELAQARRGLAAGREQERASLARELHDGAVQELAGLRYQLASTRHTVKGLPHDPGGEIKQVEGRIAQVIGQLRELIAELRPAGLDGGGLAVALENYLAPLLEGGRDGPRISMDVRPGAEDLAQPVALCLFRVAQEAIRNALEHGQPRQIAIRLRPRTRDMILRVSDDGRGFRVPIHLGTMAQAQHYGLVGMAERVAQVQGRLRVRSRPGRGTMVTVWAPLASDGKAQDDDDPGCYSG